MTENAVVNFFKKVKRSTIFKAFFGQKSVIAVCMVCVSGHVFLESRLLHSPEYGSCIFFPNPVALVG